MAEKWIQKMGTLKKGALHEQLGIPQSKKIPLGTLEKASHSPGRLGTRARLALAFRGMKHGG